MASARLKSDTVNERTQLMQKTRQIKATICTSSGKDNVDGLLTYFNRLSDMEVEFRQLPYNVCDLKDKKLLKNIDVMVLCHSIENRRLSLTNVMDALYDDLLPMAKKKLGRGKIIVIAHDFKSEDLQATSYNTRMDSLRKNQKLVFKCASHVLFCGSLTRRDLRLTKTQEKEISVFLRTASELSEEKQMGCCCLL